MIEPKDPLIEQHAAASAGAAGGGAAWGGVTGAGGTATLAAAVAAVARGTATTIAAPIYPPARVFAGLFTITLSKQLKRLRVEAAKDVLLLG